jgi:hypothetical protein
MISLSNVKRLKIGDRLVLTKIIQEIPNDKLTLGSIFTYETNSQVAIPGGTINVYCLVLKGEKFWIMEYNIQNNFDTIDSIRSDKIKNILDND